MQTRGLESMDVISDVLTHIPVKGRATGLLSLRGDWAYEAPKTDEARFHLVSGGSAVVTYRDEVIHLSDGDMIVFTRGHAHILSSAPNVPLLTAQERDERLKFVVAGTGVVCEVIEFSGYGPETTMICGRFNFGRSAQTHFKGHFPDYIVLKKNNNGSVSWLGPLMRKIAEDAQSESLGALAVLEGLLKILFVQFMRGWISTATDSSLGWLKAMRDPQIGKAIQLMHEKPAHNWSVQDLALEVGMSRSSFAARFASVAGETPLRYLTRWRMVLAAQGLETDIHRPISDIASSIGYESEASFSAAFKRQFGKPPGAWRKETVVHGSDLRGRVA